MKNKAQYMSPRTQTSIFDWMYVEEQDDDFLMGKTPKDLSDAWEEEE
jgi:hypothetical protein